MSIPIAYRRASATAVVAAVILIGANNRPQDAPRFYYSRGDSVFVTDVPHFLTGWVANPVDSLLPEQLARSLGLRGPLCSTLPSRPGFFVLEFDETTPPWSLAALRDTLGNATGLRAVYTGWRTRSGNLLLATGEVVARWKDDVIDAQVDSVTAASGYDLVEHTVAPGYRVTLHRVNSGTQDPFALAARLYESGLVRFAKPNFIPEIRTLSIPGDEYFPEQFHLRNSIFRYGIPVDIAATAAWDLNSGSGVKIAVIDGAIECNHPEFQGRVLPGYDAFAGGSGLECSPGGDGDGHGTSVAGVALGNHNSGKIAGVAPSAMLVPVRIWDPDGSPASSHEIAVAIRWAWESGGADVLNGSWHSDDYNDEVAFAIRDAFEDGRGCKGSAVIFAAGNHPVPVEFPGYVFGAYPVSGINRNGNESRYARGAAAVAPTDSGAKDGVNDWAEYDLVTADRTGSSGYNSQCQPLGCDADLPDVAYTRNFGGTSAAAPQVSGIAALIISTKPTLGAQDVYNTISWGAIDWFELGLDPLSGHGKVDAYRSVRKAGPTLDVAAWPSVDAVTRKQLVRVFDSTAYWWSMWDHTHDWRRDGSPWVIHYNRGPLDTTSFMAYAGECYETTFQANVTEAWKSGNGNTTVWVATAPGCVPREAPIAVAPSAAQQSAAILFGAGPVLLGQQPVEFYSLVAGPTATPLERDGPTTIAQGFREKRPGSFVVSTDTMTVTSVGSIREDVAIAAFEMRGQRSREATGFAFAFDPDVGDPANDRLAWLPAGEVAVVGDSSDGYWGVRLSLEGDWRQRAVPTGPHTGSPDPATPSALHDFLTSPPSATASDEPGDVRFYIVAATSSDGSRGVPAIRGHVLFASGPTAAEVARRLTSATIPTAALSVSGADDIAVLPTDFAVHQQLSAYVGPPIRMSQTSGASLVAARSEAEVVAQVRTMGIRALSIDVPQRASTPRVVVYVYSLSGRMVRRLVNDALDPGSYLVGWDGLDDAGRVVGPGVYIAVMTAEDYRGTQRLVIR